MNIQPDKWRHIYAGFAIGLVLPFTFAWLLGLYGGYNLLLSAILLSMISYGFELFSLLTGRAAMTCWMLWQRLQEACRH